MIQRGHCKNTRFHSNSIKSFNHDFNAFNLYE